MADDRVFHDNRASAMSSFKITTDKTELDVPAIHHFLGTQSTWAIGIPLATVQRAIDHSLCFGGLLDGDRKSVV